MDKQCVKWICLNIILTVIFVVSIFVSLNCFRSYQALQEDVISARNALKIKEDNAVYFEENKNQYENRGKMKNIYDVLSPQDIFSKVKEAAGETGVSVFEFQIDKAVNVILKEENFHIYEAPVLVRASGTQEDILNFIEKIENFEYYFYVSQLDLSLQEEDGYILFISFNCYYKNAGDTA